MLAASLAIVIEPTEEQTVVSLALACGAAITVTFIVAEVLAQGELGLPVSVKTTVPDFIEGVYVAASKVVSLNEPEGAFHAMEVAWLSVAPTIAIEGVVEHIVVSLAVTFGGGITVTFIVVEVLAQGELALAVSVSVTEPEVIAGVYTGFNTEVLLNEPEGALQANEA